MPETPYPGPTLCVSGERSTRTVELNLCATHTPPSIATLSMACCFVVTRQTWTYIDSAAAVEKCWTVLIQYIPANRVFVVPKANNHVFSVLLHYNILSLVWQASRVSETELSQLGTALRTACKNAVHSFKVACSYWTRSCYAVRTPGGAEMGYSQFCWNTILGSLWDLALYKTA